MAEREGRARSRWIAAVVVGAVVTLVALTVGRRHLRDVLVRTPPEPAVTDDSARVQTLLDEGIRLLESGDLDGAGERLLKASALAERDARVLGALARLETTRADITWLRTRLLDPTDEQAMEVQNRELSRRLSRARSATDAALGASTTEPSAQRAHVDVLRMAGQLDAARDMASKLPQAPLDAHQAYVLAALDLAGEEAPTAQTFERLQLARAGERTPGRAQAALVFALARAGRFDEARTELVRLETASSVAVLAPDLKAYIDRLADPVPTGPTGATTPGDIRPLIELAQRTAAKGDLDGAEALYQKALAQKPGSVEALTGLAEMARQKNDPRRAAEYYERALNYNPNYVPALVGGADQRWQAGQKKIALAYYRKVLRLVGPDTPYGRRAAARVAEAAGSAPSGAATPSTAAPTSTSTPPASGAGTTSGQTE
nr:MAG: hypothetical protein DIU78_20530 [Pseudomonadota bacterium]